MQIRRAQPSETRALKAWIAAQHYLESCPPGFVHLYEFIEGRDLIGAMILGRLFRDPIPKHYSCDRYDSYETDDSRYSLWIGEDDPKCAHCGIELDPNKTRCHKTAGRVEFNFFICAGCKAALSFEQQWNVPVP